MICKRQLPLLIAGRSQGRVAFRVGQTHKGAHKPRCKSASSKASLCVQGVSDRNGLICLSAYIYPLNFLTQKAGKFFPYGEIS